MVKRIALLGATGSIGLQTLDVVKQHKDEFEIVSIACGQNLKVLYEILDSYPVKHVSVACQQASELLKAKYPNLHVSYGDQGILNMIDVDCDVVVNALVGFIGLKPSLYAIEKGRELALANKESLVIGGELVKQALRQSHTNMYPIDSEHSAIFQCLQGNQMKEVKRLIVSASGGSFRDLTREQLKDVNVKQALSHPNWSMGKRITIDSATMMNKGFEVIEAHYLFDVDFDNIDVIINTESVVHSLVEYVDHSIIAQLGSADMRLPIQYALSYPSRLPLECEPFDLAKIGTLHFKELDFERYPLLKLAYEAGKRKGNSGAILNAADEVAVSLFLSEKISFLEIEECIFDAYRNIAFIAHPTYEQLRETDEETRAFVLKKVEG